MKNLYSRLFIIAITPAVSIALGIYLSDRYDREPTELLFKTFAFGALTVIPTIVVEKGLMVFSVLPGLFSAAYISFIVAGLTEEFFKREVVLRFIYNNKHFDEKLDGIVYAVYSALGFATVENIIYVVFRYSYNPYIGLYRGVLSVPAHAMFAVTMGYYLSLAKFSDNTVEKSKYLKKSLYMPILLHGIFNFILMAKTPYLVVVLIPYVVYIWWTNQKKLNHYIKDSRNRYHRIRDDKE